MRTVLLTLLGALLLAPAALAAEPGMTPDQAAARIERLATATQLHTDPPGPGVPEGASARAAPGPTLSTADPGFDDDWCGVQTAADDSAHQVSIAPRWKVVYANPVGTPNRFTTIASAIQHHLRQTSQLIMGASGNQRVPRFDLGTNCRQRVLDIASVRLSKPASAYSGPGLIDAVRDDVVTAVGPMAGPHDFLVFVEATDCGQEAGRGEAPPDEQHGAGNAANQPSDASTPLTAVVLHCGGENYFETGASAQWVRAPLHEMTHVMGAVHDGAPHATGAYHCWERYSVMCYDDGGPAIPAGAFTRPVQCDRSGTFEVYDCGSDDYFAVSPAAGSYLATNWNVADSVFMCAPALCYGGVATPTARLGTPAGPVAPGAAVTLTADAASANGAITEYRWDTDPAKAGFERVTTAPSLTVSYATAGSKALQVQVRDAFGQHAVGAATLEVVAPPAPAAPATVALSAPQVPKPFPVNQAVPTLSGVARVGSPLRVQTGTWVGADAFAYQWERCSTSGVCSPVPGAAGASYVAGAVDAGSRLRAVVTASNARGALSRTTAVSGVVAPLAAPAAAASFRLASGTSYSRRTGRLTVAYVVRGARAVRLRVQVAGRTRFDRTVPAAAGTHRVRIQLRGAARRSAARGRALRLGVRATLTSTAGTRTATTAGKTFRRR